MKIFILSLLVSGFAFAGAVPFDVTNWKPGDSSEYRVFDNGVDVGTLTKKVVGKTASGAWVKTVLTTNKFNITSMISYNIYGNMEKLIINGKSVPTNNFEYDVVDQTGAIINVPAGTFTCVWYIITNQSTNNASNVWFSQVETSIDNVVREEANVEGTPYVFELSTFQK